MIYVVSVSLLFFHVAVRSTAYSSGGGGGGGGGVCVNSGHKKVGEP